jgi:integrase/recombinase XerD
VSEPNDGPGWWRELCDGYLRWLTRKGRRANTKRAYGFELLAFARWLDQEGIADLEQLTGGELERFQDWRAERIKPKTQQVSAAALRGLFRWAATQEPPRCSAALWLHLSTPRTARAMPRPVAPADLAKLLAALSPRPKATDLVRLRTRALFLLILSSGARISEALSLDRDSLRDRQAIVIQKGGSEKLLVISETADEAIADYLASRSDSCPALFVGHKRVTARLRIHGAQDAWDQLSAELGISHLTSHRIRHSTATELLRQGVDSLVIAKHLGHRGLGSIAGYAEVGLATRHAMLEVLDGLRDAVEPEWKVLDLRGMSFREFCALHGEVRPDETWLPEDRAAWLADARVPA